MFEYELFNYYFTITTKSGDVNDSPEYLKKVN